MRGDITEPLGRGSGVLGTGPLYPSSLPTTADTACPGICGTATSTDFRIAVSKAKTRVLSIRRRNLMESWYIRYKPLGSLKNLQTVSRVSTTQPKWGRRKTSSGKLNNSLLLLLLSILSNHSWYLCRIASSPICWIWIGRVRSGIISWEDSSDDTPCEWRSSFPFGINSLPRWIMSPANPKFKGKSNESVLSLNKLAFSNFIKAWGWTFSVYFTNRTISSAESRRSRKKFKEVYLNE